MEIGLVDALGGIHRAIAIAKQCAEMTSGTVRTQEISRSKGSPLEMLQVALFEFPLHRAD